MAITWDEFLKRRGYSFDGGEDGNRVYLDTGDGERKRIWHPEDEFAAGSGVRDWFNEFSKTDAQGRPVYGTELITHAGGPGTSFTDENGQQRYRIGSSWDQIAPEYQKWIQQSGWGPQDIQYDPKYGYHAPQQLQDEWHNKFQAPGYRTDLVRFGTILAGPLLAAAGQAIAGGVGAAAGEVAGSVFPSAAVEGGLTAGLGEVASQAGSALTGASAASGGLNVLESTAANAGSITADQAAQWAVNAGYTPAELASLGFRPEQIAAATGSAASELGWNSSLGLDGPLGDSAAKYAAGMGAVNALTGPATTGGIPRAIQDTAIKALINGAINAGAGALVNAATKPDGSAANASSASAQDALSRQIAILEAQYKHWADNFAPLEKGLTADAATFGSPAEQERAAGKAHADVAQQFAGQRDQLRRNMASYGINPNSGRFESQILNMGNREAATDAWAQNTAREREKTLGFDKKMAVGQLGRNIPSSVASGLGSAANTSANLAGQQFNQNQFTAAQARQGLAPLVSTLTGAAKDWFGSVLKPSGTDQLSGIDLIDEAYI